MKTFRYLFLMMAAIGVVAYSCRKDEDEDPAPVSPSTISTAVTISGTVRDESNQPLIGVIVTSGSFAGVTNQYGIFNMSGSMSENRCLVHFEKPGFLKRDHGFFAKENAVNYLKIVLTGEPLPQTLSASAGGNISVTSGGSVQFQPNGIVLAGSTTPYTGIVTVVAKHLAVNDPNFGSMIPGGDLSGRNASDENVSLYSYGMTGVTMTGSGGEPLQLETGSTATVTFPIAASQLGTAPPSIPLWYLDETTGIWKEEGVATKTGSNYVGTVSHFSWWNCDYPFETATISGRVVDCEGIPLANITVTVNGNMTLVTDANGTYSNWVPAGMALTIQVLPQGAIPVASPLISIPALSSGQNYPAADLAVACASFITGTMTNCANQLAQGYACIYSGNTLISSVFTTSGVFRLMVPANQSLGFSAGSSSGYISQPVLTVAASDSLELGTLQLCNQVTSEFDFNISGGLYGNQYVSIPSPNTDCHFDTASQSTIIYLDGNSNVGFIYMDLNFDGNQPRTFHISNIDSAGIMLYMPNYMYWPEPNFIIEITEYGNVGDTIRGAFSGTMYSGIDSVFISNGRFAVVRGEDW